MKLYAVTPLLARPTMGLPHNGAKGRSIMPLTQLPPEAAIGSTAFFWFFLIAIAREASPSRLYERRRTYPGAERSHLKRTAQAAPSGNPTGAALGLVARDFGSVDNEPRVKKQITQVAN